VEAKALENFFHEQIPLTRHMQVGVAELGPPGLCLSAPLEANANLHGTAFGGSIASLAVLAGWALLHTRTRSAGINCSIVVQKSEISYERAIRGNFTSCCIEPENSAWDKFTRTLQKRGKSRITLDVVVEYDNQVAARLQATYAAEKTASSI